MAKRPYHFIALAVFPFLLNEAAQACSCAEPSFLSKRAQEKYERESIRKIWPHWDTFVLVRTVSASRGNEPDSQRATLAVVRAWKGPYKEGEVIESYTEGVGGGMCEMPIPTYSPFLLRFNGAKADLNGCPSDFLPTPAKSRELDKLKSQAEKAAKKSPAARSGAAPRPDLSARLDEAAERWKSRRVTSYSYVIEEKCMFCSPSTRVVVRDGTCFSALGASAASGKPACADRTVPELFAMIRAQIEDRSGSTIEVTFDPTWGYPTYWSIETHIPDDWGESWIRRFRIDH